MRPRKTSTHLGLDAGSFCGGRTAPLLLEVGRDRLEILRLSLPAVTTSCQPSSLPPGRFATDHIRFTVAAATKLRRILQLFLLYPPTRLVQPCTFIFPCSSVAAGSSSTRYSQRCYLYPPNHTIAMDPGPASPTFPDQRPRTRSRGISFRSDKSAGSDGRTKLTDSPRDKAQRDILWAGQTKSNPNAAMNEVQPGGTLVPILPLPLLFPTAALPTL